MTSIIYHHSVENTASKTLKSGEQDYLQEWIWIYIKVSNVFNHNNEILIFFISKIIMKSKSEVGNSWCHGSLYEDMSAGN